MSIDIKPKQVSLIIVEDERTSAQLATTRSLHDFSSLNKKQVKYIRQLMNEKQSNTFKDHNIKVENQLYPDGSLQSLDIIQDSGEKVNLFFAKSPQELETVIDIHNNTLQNSHEVHMSLDNNLKSGENTGALLVGAIGFESNGNTPLHNLEDGYNFQFTTVRISTDGRGTDGNIFTTTQYPVRYASKDGGVTPCKSNPRTPFVNSTPSPMSPSDRSRSTLTGATSSTELWRLAASQATSQGGSATSSVVASPRDVKIGVDPQIGQNLVAPFKKLPTRVIYNPKLLFSQTSETIV